MYPAPGIRQTIRAVDVVERLYIVSGGSMYPTLVSGDWVEAVPKSPVPGDILICLTHDGQLVVHRMTGVRGGGSGEIVTRGDNVPVSDPPWSSEQVVGVVTRIIRPEGDIVPENRITFAHRLRWVYLTLRWYSHRVQQGLMRINGCRRPTLTLLDGIQQPKSKADSISQAVESGIDVGNHK